VSQQDEDKGNMPKSMDTFLLKPSHLIETVKTQPARANQVVLFEQNMYNRSAHNSCKEGDLLPPTAIDAAMTSNQQPLLQQTVLQYNTVIIVVEVSCVPRGY
jgi:hypothetical protein